MSHYSRSAKYYKDQGVKTWKVEMAWNKFTKQRLDLFHIFDMIALDSGIVGVQVFGGSEMQSHIAKITVEYADNTKAWLECGGLAELHCWRKLKVKRGGKAIIWKCRIVDILLINNKLYTEERENQSKQQ